MNTTRISWDVPLVFLLVSMTSTVARPVDLAAGELPAAWQQAWESPGPQHRPLQIVHGIDLQGQLPEGIEQMVAGSRPGRIARAGMQHYRDHGLGGLVCNVAFQDYMTSEQNWKTLVAAVEACHELGLIVWIYDEQGYPSGAAGGLVLQGEPGLRGHGTGLRRRQRGSVCGSAGLRVHARQQQLLCRSSLREPDR